MDVSDYTTLALCCMYPMTHWQTNKVKNEVKGQFSLPLLRVKNNVTREAYMSFLVVFAAEALWPFQRDDNSQNTATFPITDDSSAFGEMLLCSAPPYRYPKNILFSVFYSGEIFI